MYNHQNKILVDFFMDSFSMYIYTHRAYNTKVPLKFHLKLTNEQFTSWMIFAAYPTFVA